MNTIYIGGTGRCGSNLFTDLLRHFPCWGPDFETRFTVDPYGLFPLVCTLSYDSSPFVISSAINNFLSFLDKVAKKNECASAPYSDWDLECELPGFCAFREKCVAYFDASSYVGSFPGSNFLNHEKLFCVDRIETLNFLRENYQNYISQNLKEKNSSVYLCDNTYNLHFCDAIDVLHPSSLIVWVKRNPISVISSFLEQKWAPSSVQSATRLYLNSEASIHKKFAAAKNPKMEIYYEDLLIDPKKILQNVGNSIGVDLFINENVKISRNKMRPQEYVSKDTYLQIKKELERNCR